MYEAIIFDLDGTLLDTLDDLAGAVNHALEKFALAPRTKEEIRSFVGNGISMLIRRAIGVEEHPLFDGVLAEFKNYYSAHCAESTKPYNGILPLLKALKLKGVKMAVVSNKADFATRLLAEKYFPNLLDEVVGENEAAGIRKKPSPDSLLAVMQRLGLKKTSTLYVGDSEVDIQTAQNAGVDCACVTWGFKDETFLKENGAKTLVGTAAEILFLCEKPDFEEVEARVGNTPLIELKSLQNVLQLKARLFAKIEGANPGGSIKDRAALAIIDDAEKSGRLQKGGTVIESTSGNTGIGLALVAKARGYRAVIVMPDSMSMERRLLLKAYGAELVLTDGKLGMKGAVEKAEALAREIPGSVLAGQFDNPANAKAHYLTTGREIDGALNGKTDIFIAGVGTGGTITGAGKYLKEKNPQVRVVAVEPARSPLLSKGYAAGHGIQGIGANFVPSILDKSVYDEVICVSDEDAIKWAKLAMQKEKLFVGISSGAALCAGIELALKEENAGKNIVLIFPDNGTRYLSTPLFE